ncbi:MAG: peptide deformylase [bacterium]
MILPIIKYPSPILKKKAEKVKNIDEDVRELIRQMKETMAASDGVGLAAPQVGVSKRIIVVNTKKGPRAFINPEVIESGKKRKKSQEGCLSFPGLWLKIVRPKTVKIEAIDENGREVKIEAKEISAIVFQHEIDHINGIEFIKRASIIEKIKAHRILAQLKRDYGINRRAN